MSFETLVEKKIRQALADGEFDDLPGKGQPLNLDEYFAAPEDNGMKRDILCPGLCRYRPVNRHLRRAA